LLALVPYVVRHPGTSLEELARVFGVNRGDLTNDLNLLFVAGLPPYGPGDLVDVQIEGDRVWISMADHFSRPVRLTRGEALALYLGATALLGAEGPEAEALQGALKKLREALGGAGPEDLHLEVEQAAGRRGPLEAVHQAAERRERIEIDYYSASRDEVTTRQIDPEQVFSAIGNWYVVAWDRQSDEERMFRVDRIRDVRATGEGFEPRGLLGQGRPLYDRSAEDLQVRLLLRPGARWVAEYYEVERATPRGKDLEVVLPAKDLAWVAKLVLRLGGEAEVLDPPELQDLARRAAVEALALYAR
jgi:proteasome accessory factor C